MREILYPSENPQVCRLSSIDQFGDFLSVYKKGGWAPIIFDQLDGITCDKVKTHPVIISYGNDIGYVFPEKHCVHTSDKFIYFDKEGVEQKPLPSCFGGVGEFYDEYYKGFSFINFGNGDDGNSVGVHNTKTTRVGLDVCLAKETLPSAD